MPELITHPFADENGALKFDEKDFEKIDGVNAVAFGMGCGVSENTYEIARRLLKNFKGVLLIDADGLNSLAAFGVKALKNSGADVVVTPHVKEFSRLTGRSVEEIENDMIGSAKAFAKEYGVTVLLKSAVSVVAGKEGVLLNTTGNSGMAKGGSGDVLSGAVAGIAARGFPAFDAAAAGAFLCGLAGDLAAKEQNEYTITPSDTVAHFSQAIDEIADS